MSTPHPAPRRPVTVRLARWSATNPWRAVALWLAFVAAAVAVGSLAGLHTGSDIDDMSGQSQRAARWIDHADLTAPSTENVLVTARSGTLDRGAAREALAAAGRRMHALPAVAAVGAPATAPDGSAMTVQITLHDDVTVQPLLDATKAVQHDYPALRVEEVGSKSLGDAVNKQVGDDLSAAGTYSLPVTLIILMVAFGAIVAAGVPLLLALSAVGAATGLNALVSHLVPSIDTASSMILLMGMAVGVDYSLFYVKRARAERHRGHSQLDAVEIAAETAGHSVLVSGFAVIVSMIGLYLAQDATFEALANATIIVVAVAVLGSLTVLPALLVKLGRRLDRPRLPVLWRLTTQDREPRFWLALLRPSLQHPARTLTVSVLALAALALPALSLKLASDSPQSLPDSMGAKHVLTRLNAAFPNHQAEQEIAVQAGAGQAHDVDAALRNLARTAAASGSFLHQAPRIDRSTDGTVTVLRLDAPYDAESAAARTGVERLRNGLVGDALHGVPGARWAVSGDTASSMDTDKHMADGLPWVVGFVVLFTMIVMGWVFRSAVIALVTAVVNLLSSGVAFGVLALTFQHSWAESLLGFHSTGKVINWIPLFTFAVLFGLSMDYHVFVLSRIREAARRGLSTRDAVREGIAGSAGTVTSAAVVMVSVFAIFASLHMVEMKEFGIGLAVAVLVDALVVRAIVLPSLMMLLGRHIWWPGQTGARADAAAPERELAGV